MTIAERNIKLKHFITCLKCEIHGRECDDNCPIQYEAGHMGEIIENLEKISKVLEQQPCEDAISREYLVEHIKACWTNGRPMYSPDLSELLLWIDDVPPVQPKTGHWIPCSERLPKKERKTYWVCTDTEYQCECRWTNNRFGLGEGEWGWSIFDTPQYSKPIAWMPLPEPYKTKMDGKE